MLKIYCLTLLCLILPVSGIAKNGFDLSQSSIAVDLIKRGGPPKDGIPAIDSPLFVSAGEAGWLADTDRVMGISVNGEQRAYPIAILNWHELVNDEIAGTPIVVSFCPLCGTGMIFSAQVNGQSLKFGVSGLLFQSDVLLYDRASESLWSQLWMEALTGRFVGEQLELLVSEHTTWQDWQSRYPETKVLSRETGYRRDYSRNPYEGYDVQRRLYFPVENQDDSVHPKAWVMGLVYDGHQKAWTFDALESKGQSFTDTIGEREIRVEFDPVNRVGRVWEGDTSLPVIQAYWFAWYAFYPDSVVVK